MGLTIIDLGQAKQKAMAEAAALALAPKQEKVLEAAAPLIFYGSPADFEGGFRRISQPTSPWRDLLPPMQWNMQRVCYYLYVTNPLAHRIVELNKDFIVGEGVTVQATDPGVQDTLDEFWNDSVNRMDVNLEAFVRDLSIFGETVWFGDSNAISGKARIGYIDPYWIDGVEYATLAGLPGKAMAFASAVILKTGPTEPEQTRLTIVQLDENPASPTFGSLVGNGFYWAVNKARSGHRGMSDLFALSDWLDGYDQMLFSVMNLMDSLSRFIWDVELTGMTGEQIEEWLKKHGTPPRPNSVRAHNEKVKWSSVSPAIQATDKAEGVRMIKNHALAGAGFPEHWFAEGDKANRATALVQGEPTLKMLTSRQRYVKHMLTQVLEWAIDCKVRAGALPESVDRSFTLNFPELSVGDQQAIATAINQAAQGLVAFQGLGAVDRKTAAKFVSQMAAQMGIEVDIDEVLDNAEQDAAAKKAEDFTDPDLFGSGNPNRNRKDAGEPGTTTELPPGVSADGAPDGGRERGMNAWCGDHKLDEEKIANAGN